MPPILDGCSRIGANQWRAPTTRAVATNACRSTYLAVVDTIPKRYHFARHSLRKSTGGCHIASIGMRALGWFCSLFNDFAGRSR